MSEETKKIIALVIQTLDGITVHGKDNLNSLLASIMTLERLLEEKEETENG